MLATLFVTVGFTLLVLFTLLFEVTLRGVADAVRAAGRASSPTRSVPIRRRLGCGRAIYGSFFIGLGVVVLAFPLGIGAAIYLEEYARDSFLTRLIMVSMCAISPVCPPSIYGVLGFIIFRRLARA